LGTDILQGTIKQDWPINIMVAQAEGVLRNPGEFWNALDNDLKPAVVYAVTLPVDLNVFHEAPLALSSVTNLADARQERVGRKIALGGMVRTKGKGKTPGAPVVGALVSFPKIGISVRTGGNGRYFASGIPDGTHQVIVTEDGGKPVERELVVPSRAYDLEV
ncbi:MAG TPA: carboxypeptidase-like regulatory domain-containing protein, partial [Chloroflexota bacterium]|nr:carboxypeptidase-like regulatory domain-containing protein [Chloroflexota bacterium]